LTYAANHASGSAHHARLASLILGFHENTSTEKGRRTTQMSLPGCGYSVVGPCLEVFRSETGWPLQADATERRWNTQI
jgi:hypothetical protein